MLESNMAEKTISEGISHSYDKSVVSGPEMFYNKPKLTMGQSCGLYTEKQRQRDFLKRMMEQKRDVSMSYVHAIIAHNRLIFASESRSTLLWDGKTASGYSDGFQKVAYLPKLKCGVVAAGFNTPNGIPIMDFLDGIDKEMSGSATQSFTTSATVSTQKWEVPVQSRLEYIISKLQPYIPDDSVVNIACGGFEGDKAVLAYADIRHGLESEIKDVGIIWHVNSHLIPLFCQPDGTFAAHTADVRSLLDFSDFLVRTETELGKYLSPFPSVGGPIQTLLMENGEAKWIHSLY